MQRFVHYVVWNISDVYLKAIYNICMHNTKAILYNCFDFHAYRSWIDGYHRELLLQKTILRTKLNMAFETTYNDYGNFQATSNYNDACNTHEHIDANGKLCWSDVADIVSELSWKQWCYQITLVSENMPALPERDIISSARKRHQQRQKETLCHTHTHALSISLSLSLAAPQLVDIAHS